MVSLLSSVGCCWLVGWLVAAACRSVGCCVDGSRSLLASSSMDGWLTLVMMLWAGATAACAPAAESFAMRACVRACVCVKIVHCAGRLCDYHEPGPQPLEEKLPGFLKKFVFIDLLNEGDAQRTAAQEAEAKRMEEKRKQKTKGARIMGRSRGFFD